MKKAILLTGTVITFACTAFVLSFNFYERDKILIVKSNSHVELQAGCSKKELIRVFGKPDKDEKYFFETDDKMGSRVIYGTNQFYFLNGKLESFTIKTPDFAIRLSKYNAAITVGASANFPKGTSKHSPEFMAYDLKNADGRSTDQFLEFDLKPNKRVEKIILGDY